MHRTGFILLAMFLLGAAASAPYRVAWLPHRFADCNAASLFAIEHPTVGEYRYRLRSSLDHISIAAVPSLGFRASARVSYSLDPAQSVMSLPKWTWPEMNAEQQSAMRDFLDALRNHELGHHDIARRALRQQSTITVIAPTRRAAEQGLLSARARQLRDQYAETIQSERTYDRVTGHGLHQGDGPTYGFRGGRSVTFSCR